MKCMEEKNNDGEQPALRGGPAAEPPCADNTEAPMMQFDAHAR